MTDPNVPPADPVERALQLLERLVVTVEGIKKRLDEAGLS